MKKNYFILFLLIISLIFAGFMPAVYGCKKLDEDKHTPVSATETQPLENQPKTTQPGRETSVETGTAPGQHLSEEEILKQVEEMFMEVEKPYRLIEFLDQNMRYLSKENASKSLDMLEDLMSLHEMIYTDLLFFGNDGNYQQKINEYFSMAQKQYSKVITRNHTVIIDDEDLDALLEELFDSGYELINLEGSWYPAVDYSNFVKFKSFLTDDYSQYISFVVEESENIFAEDAALLIEWDEIASRIITLEDFLLNYPSSSKYGEMGYKYFQYTGAYLNGLDNTLSYDFETKLFLDEVIESYRGLLDNEQYSDYFITGLIDGYVEIIEQNSRIMNENVKEFISKSYDEIEQKFGIINIWQG